MTALGALGSIFPACVNIPGNMMTAVSGTLYAYFTKNRHMLILPLDAFPPPTTAFIFPRIVILTFASQVLSGRNIPKSFSDSHALTNL